MAAYYNEIDPVAAAWLRNLINAGHIAPGEVDQRSIEDVRPDDLRGFTQCHFFAGIGVWSYALRRAGVADSTRVWTGSCPCQPFSAAGKGDGFADERHLWPAWHHLVAQCEPAVVVGEQVASVAVDPWIDLVQTDMEALGYAFGAVPFPSAGVGAPHIRDRCYWVADAADQRRIGRRTGSASDGRHAAWCEPERLCNAGGLADANHAGLEGRGGMCQRAAERAAGPGGVAGGLADADCSATSAGQGNAGEVRGVQAAQREPEDGAAVSGGGGSDGHTGPTNGLWAAADWLLCRDGKWRPVEPGTFPLAHGAPARVGRLRAFGNAINAEAAVAFIKAAGLA